MSQAIPIMRISTLRVGPVPRSSIFGRISRLQPSPATTPTTCWLLSQHSNELNSLNLILAYPTKRFDFHSTLCTLEGFYVSEGKLSVVWIVDNNRGLVLGKSNRFHAGSRATSLPSMADK